jgi:macrolide-specific efflux system membrane fusion protein
MRHALLLLAPLLLLACSGPDLAAPREVAPLAAAPRPSAVAAPFAGGVAARHAEVVAAQLEGRVVHVTARSGATIHAGDLIAELDPTLVNQRVAAARAAEEAARADVAGAAAEGSEAARQVALEQRMVAAGASPQEAVRIARAGYARASASGARAAAALHQAEATRAELEAELAHTRLLAPIDGVVSLVKVQDGQVVAQGTPIARVFDPRALTVRFQVPRPRHGELAVGDHVTIAVAGAPRPLSAVVTTLSADLEPPLDFAVAEADIVDEPAAHDVQVGTLGEVRVAAR